MVPKDEIESFFRFGNALISKSRALILSHLDMGFKTSEKGDKTLVTTIDLATEELIRNEITKCFPEHGIIGEEFENTSPNADFQWIIDPIDGTLNLARGIPTFGTILALHYKNEGIVGFLDHPAIGQCFSAAKGIGAYCNNKKISVKNYTDSPDVFGLGSRDVFLRSGDEKLFDLLADKFPKFRVYYDCFLHGLTSQGSISAAVEYNCKIWDIAATKLLIEEAGGVFHEVGSWDDDGETRYNSIFGRNDAVESILSVVKNVR